MINFEITKTFMKNIKINFEREDGIIVSIS